MTRKKVKLAYITNDSARKVTFNKRKKGLLKKVDELSTLCGIDACAIIYSPYDREPDLWPSTLGVQRVIARFSRMPDMEQSKNMANQESFLKKRIAKTEGQLKKKKRENREMEMTEVMYRSLVGEGLLQNLNMFDLTELGWLVEENIKEIEKKTRSLLQPMADEMRNGGVVANGEEAKRVLETAMDATQSQQWYMELLKQNQDKGFGGDQIMPPNAYNNNGLLSSFFFL